MMFCGQPKNRAVDFFKCLTMGIAVLVAQSYRVCRASEISLGLIIDPVNQTWAVTAASNDNLNLGIAAFSIDVDGGGGVSILPSMNRSETIAAPQSTFNIFRSAGKSADSNLNSLQGSQDIIGADESRDDSGLHYGYGLTSSAHGSFVGDVNGDGPFTIAQGRYTAADSGGTIIAHLSAGCMFNLFRPNYSVIPGLSGASQATMAATRVNSIGFDLSTGSLFAIAPSPPPAPAESPKIASPPVVIPPPPVAPPPVAAPPEAAPLPGSVPAPAEPIHADSPPPQPATPNPPPENQPTPTPIELPTTTDLGPIVWTPPSGDVAQITIDPSWPKLVPLVGEDGVIHFELDPTYVASTTVDVTMATMLNASASGTRLSALDVSAFIAGGGASDAAAPTPEPASFILAVAGLAALASIRIRRALR